MHYSLSISAVLVTRHLWRMFSSISQSIVFSAFLCSVSMQHIIHQMIPPYMNCYFTTHPTSAYSSQILAEVFFVFSLALILKCILY